jgi:drug/metabolite transporter (DMT)-like permease
MEVWLIYAIISIFSAGLFSFGTKIATERNYNASLMSVYLYTFGAVIAGVVYLFSPNKELIENMLVVTGWASLASVLFLLAIITRVKGMKYVDAVIFFPIHKTIGPVLVTISSLFYFSESLTAKEMIGILIGICVPILLITKTESKIQKNLKSGFVFIVTTSILTALVSSISKLISANGFSIDFYIFIFLFSGIFSSLFSYKFIQKNDAEEEYSTKGILFFSTILALFFFMANYAFVKALERGLAIVFTINSFSILVPVILSVLFYKDHFSIKKAFIVVLSIISIILFI